MKRAAILYEASQAVLSTFDPDEVFQQILAIVRDHFHLQSAAILLIDRKTQELYCRAHFGSSSADPSFRLPIGKGLSGAAAQSKQAIYVPDVSQDPRYVHYIFSTKSELAIPLMVKDEVVGVLDLQSDQLNFFDSETIDLLNLFSMQASIALQNAQLYSLERRRAAQLEAINAIAQQTTAVLDLNDLLRKVCSLILQSFKADHVTVLLREEDHLVVRAHEGKLTEIIPPGGTLSLDKGLSGRAYTTQKFVMENDVAQSAAYVPGYRETRAELALPLISFGQVLGVMILHSANAGAFQDSDVQSLESVSDIVANAIQNAYYVDRVRQLAYIDGLTGVFNRRFFEVRIVEEIERAARYSGAMAVLMVDIDHFKKLNDEFGHLLGDEVLKQVSALFVQHIRKIDVVCRYGGEEFAILLPETTGENAVAVSEKLRRDVETFHFPGVPRPVTISIGVADYPEHGSNRDELVRAADSALYAAKQAGRNRVLPATISSAQSAR